MPRGWTSTRNASVRVSTANFYAAYAPMTGVAHPAGDRAHVDDAPAAPPEQWQRRLCDRDEADHVHVELFSELGDREDLDGRRDDDAGIVDQTREAVGARVAAHVGESRRDGIRIRDIEDDWREPRRGLTDERFAVTRSPHPGPDAEPEPIQVKRAGGTDAGRGAGDEDGAAETDRRSPRDPSGAR
jgi:hypothetical protein